MMDHKTGKVLGFFRSWSIFLLVGAVLWWFLSMPSIVQGVALDSNGNALASPSVTVLEADTTTEATIFSDKAGATEKANPFTGDAAGRWSFYVATGTYDLLFVAGTNTYTLEDVEVQDLLTHASRHHEGGDDEIDADQLVITTPLSLIVAPASGLQTAIGRIESYLIDADGHVLWQLENLEAGLKDVYELAEQGVGPSAAAFNFPWDPRLHWESSFLDSLRNAESNIFLVAEQAFTGKDHGTLTGLATATDDDHPQYLHVDPRFHWESSFLDQLRNMESSIFHVAEQAFLQPVATGGGKLLQMVHTETGAVTTGTTVTVSDDSIMEKTEGDEWMTLTITPAATDNRLIIFVNLNIANSGQNYSIIGLFQDATTNALKNVKVMVAGAATNIMKEHGFIHEMAAGTTSATTFKVRSGGIGAGTETLNGESGARLLGGVALSSITIMEID